MRRVLILYGIHVLVVGGSADRLSPFGNRRCHILSVRRLFESIRRYCDIGRETKLPATFLATVVSEIDW